SGTVANLAGGSSGQCLVFTDGHVVGVLLTKPEAIWRTDLALRYYPEPAPAQTPPLNPDWVICEDSRLYRDGDGHWLSSPDRATEVVARLVHVRAGLGRMAGHKSEYAVPVVDGAIPESTWRACEFDCLARSALTAARDIAHEIRHASPFLSMARRRANLVWMHNAKADYEQLRRDYQGLQAPQDATQRHSAILTALDRGQTFCEAVTEYWDQILPADPSGRAKAYTMHRNKLLQTLTKRGSEPEQIAGDLTQMLNQLDRELEAKGITRVTR
ncbi:MAG: hypothetical protein PVH68_13795, partial [Armatimonadota bacterium]